MSRLPIIEGAGAPIGRSIDSPREKQREGEASNKKAALESMNRKATLRREVRSELETQSRSHDSAELMTLDEQIRTDATAPTLAKKNSVSTPSNDIQQINHRVSLLTRSQQAKLRISQVLVRLFGRLNDYFGGEQLSILTKGETISPGVFVIRYVRQLEQGELVRDVDGERQLQACFQKMSGMQRFTFRIWAKNLCYSCSVNKGFELARVPATLFP